mgnify:CR=1 FL=1
MQNFEPFFDEISDFMLLTVIFYTSFFDKISHFVIKFAFFDETFYFVLPKISTVTGISNEV